ncbi:hypothetical protein SNE40_017318 [Patella caerulea]|uniref:Ig-like domain-containing protein n=1 Tax=Patella caerulea TaxID=87958 RepID=A0AAN8P9I1_PATCE
MICDIIKTVLVILVLRQEVAGYLEIRANQDTAPVEYEPYELRCSKRKGGWGTLGEVDFYRNFTKVATIRWKGVWGPLSCIIKVHMGNDGDYGCKISPYTKTLIIRNTTFTRDSNTTWHCWNDKLRGSNLYTLYVNKDSPLCKLTTFITRTTGGQINDVLELTEGEDLVLNCSATIVTGTHSDISYQWRVKQERGLKYTTGSSVYEKLNTTRADAGHYMCIARTNSNCTKVQEVYLAIQYPLSLNTTVNATSEAVELICRVVGGYPTNYTMNNWRHYIDGQFVREIEGVTTEDRTALVLNNNILNEGTYVCNASNGIADFKGSVFQTDETYITIEAPPMALGVSIASGTHVGSEVEIKAAFIIGGDAYNISGYQQQQNSSHMTEIPVDTKFAYGIRPVNIYGTVINKHVTIISGSVTISKMVDLTVTVTVCNEYGCTDSYQLVTVLPEITSPIASTLPRKANNDDLISNDELPVNVPVIAGGVVGAVVLIALIILIIILVRRRSNNRNKCAGTVRQNQPNSFRYKNPMYDTSQAQPINDQCLYDNDNLMKNQQQITDNQTMEIMENDLYISADDETNPRGTGLQNSEMEIMENDLYISADDDKNADGAETKPEMEILENDLYIPAEIDNHTFQGEV